MHLIISTKLTRLLDTYVSERQPGLVGVEKMGIRLTRNDYEPDLCFFTKARAKNFTPDQGTFSCPGNGNRNSINFYRKNRPQS